MKVNGLWALCCALFAACAAVVLLMPRAPEETGPLVLTGAVLVFATVLAFFLAIDNGDAGGGE